MQLIGLDLEGIREGMGRPTIPALYLTIAKHLVVGMDSRSIAEVLGVAVDEITEIEENKEFEEVRLYVAMVYAEAQTAVDISWDAIEHQALINLSATVQINKDAELNLRIAAVANKASRRHRTLLKPLDSAIAGRRVKLTLTERTVRRLEASSEGKTLADPRVAANGTGQEILPPRSSMEQAVETTLVVEVESTASPTFEEIDVLLGVTSGAQNDLLTSEQGMSVDDLVAGVRRSVR